jgi:hypothetical protein
LPLIWQKWCIVVDVLNLWENDDFFLRSWISLSKLAPERIEHETLRKSTLPDLNDYLMLTLIYDKMMKCWDSFIVALWCYIYRWMVIFVIKMIYAWVNPNCYCLQLLIIWNSDDELYILVLRTMKFN